MARYVTAAVARDVGARLTARDLAAMHYVCELRYVNGSQLTRAHFADGDPAADTRAARRALLRLVRLDVLERLPRVVGGVRSGSAGFVYRLGLVGQRLALEHGWLGNRRRRRSVIPGTLFVNHCLQVAELHTLLAEADRSRRIEVLELGAEPACWRSYAGIGAQRGTLKPDSYLRLGVGAYEDSYFIEVDMGTEGSRALDRQLKTYLDYEASGQEQAERGVFPKTLWLAPDTRRVSDIESCVLRLPRPAHKLFQVAPFADAVNVVSGTANGQFTTRTPELASDG
jgi:Replication-relaxation